MNKYKSAYLFLLEYWESFSKEQKKEINLELNKIFGKKHKELVNDLNEFGFTTIEKIHKNNFNIINLLGLKIGSVLILKTNKLHKEKVSFIHPLYGWIITKRINEGFDNTTLLKMDLNNINIFNDYELDLNKNGILKEVFNNE